MKITVLFAVASATISLLSAPALGAVVSSPEHDRTARENVPAPDVVVAPVDLPRSYIGAKVRLILTVDANGHAHDIAVLSPAEPRLVRNLVAAVNQWRFTPAHKDGVPVTMRVVLPLILEDGS